MTREDWLQAAKAHNDAADTFLRNSEPEAAARELAYCLDALAEVDRPAEIPVSEDAVL